MPNLNNIHGLRRIDLSQNTLIGDRGAKIIADALKDDMWIKGISLVHSLLLLFELIALSPSAPSFCAFTVRGVALC